MTAQDGLDAIEHLHERIPDLMLLDIEMPRMDGYELAEHMRADPRLRHIPIVMITSRAGQKHRKKAREAGANAYLTKPYQEAELIAQVGEMLKLELQQRRTD
jgi:chemosensory pili system protein ChpA (sensor histidine kinase/response regulator)